MFAYQFAMALALLNAPPERLETLNLDEHHAELAPAMRKLAIALEILDRKEQYLLEDAKHFAADVRLLSGRYRDFAGVPRLAECERLPTFDMVDDFLAVNRKFRQGIAERLPNDPAHSDELRVVLEETEQLYQVWHSVSIARCAKCYVTARRHALKELRDRIGAADYFSGRLPPNVPMWRID